MFNAISEVIIAPDYSRAVPASLELVEAIEAVRSEFTGSVLLAEFRGELVFVEVTKVDANTTSVLAWHTTRV
jgi:hypothetical protein